MHCEEQLQHSQKEQDANECDDANLPFDEILHFLS